MIDISDFKSEYKNYTWRKTILTLIIAVAALFAGILEISLGPYNIGFFEAYNVLFNHISGVEPINTIDDYIVWERNVPRAMATLAVGGGLGVCGAAMQGALKNPMADPYITGISSGASLGASLAIISGFCVVPFLSGSLSLIVNSFVFSLIPLILILTVSSFKKSVSPTMMILIGVATMYMFTAITTLLRLTASDEDYAAVYAWSLGTLGSVTWDTVGILILAAAFGIIALHLLSSKLNILSLGNNLPVSLGVDQKRIRLYVLTIVSFVTAILVSFTGTIGFVGLVAPHIMRKFIGSDNKYLIPASAASGAMMLSVSDCIAIELTPTGLPVGVITSLIGGPIFIYLLVKSRRTL